MQHFPITPEFLTDSEQLKAALRHAIWNRIVPNRAVAIDDSGPTHIRYLHPTKGWKRVSRKRLELSNA